MEVDTPLVFNIIMLTTQTDRQKLFPTSSLHSATGDQKKKMTETKISYGLFTNNWKPKQSKDGVLIMRENEYSEGPDLLAQAVLHIS